MLKIKNTKHLDTAEEVFTEFLDKFQKYAFEASEISKGKYNLSPADKLKALERLQTMPDNYTAAVSASQRYKALGNGWTAEVIKHILGAGLRSVDRNEKLLVLSMYDGIGTGRYVLDSLGFRNVEYHSYEIDKFAIKVANSNYDDIIQHGDAFDLRRSDWRIEP